MRIINYFKVKAGQSYEEWRGRGWIHKDDPRGWFEWYCKFSLGRRHEDDDRQIKRWLAFCGPKGRWRNYIYSKIYYSGCDIDDVKCVYRKMQQSLLHWSYIVNEADYELWLSVKKPPQLLKWLLGMELNMKDGIKTSCGLEKYETLNKRTGLFSRLRFYWFVFFASIRDFNKKRDSDQV